MVFQEYNLVERLSVIENVLCGRLGYVPVWRAWLRKFPAADVDRAFQLLDAVGLGDFATQRADQLSGGQRQRVGIARALMQEPDLVLADEPTSSLDPKTSVEIMELIARRAGERGIPAIVNIHNVELARRFADRIIGMSKGEIVFDGPPQALRGLASAADLRRRRLARMSDASLCPRARGASPSRRTGRRGSRWLALALYVVYACIDPRHHLGALRRRARARRALHLADVSAQLRARQARAALQRHAREPADRDHRDRGRRAAVAPARARGRAQPRRRCRWPGPRAR